MGGLAHSFFPRLLVMVNRVFQSCVVTKIRPAFKNPPGNPGCVIPALPRSGYPRDISQPARHRGFDENRRSTMFVRDASTAHGDVSGRESDDFIVSAGRTPPRREIVYVATLGRVAVVKRRLAIRHNLCFRERGTWTRRRSSPPKIIILIRPHKSASNLVNIFSNPYHSKNCIHVCVSVDR